METRKLKDLVPYDRNPRKNGPAIDKVLESLNRHGQVKPIVLSAIGKPFEQEVICCGHTTMQALKKFGAKEAKVVVKEFESEAEFIDYNIRDNKSGEFAEWDEAMLAQLGAEFEIDLGEMGFEFDAEESKEGLTDEDDVPEVPAEPVAKLGQMWKLGSHRLLCGDSTDKEQVEKLMGGEKADMVFTDPPYGMFLDTDFSSMDGLSPDGKSFLGTKGGKKHKTVIGDNEDFKPELIKTVFDNFGYCKEIFMWGADYYTEILEAKNDGAWIVWDKRTNEDSFDIDKAISSDRALGSSFELCWSRSKHKREIARIRGGIFGVKNESGNSKKVHPTQKPIQLGEWFFEKWGKSGDLVADLYGGSGSTLIACEKTGRKCRMIEMDPKYCDVIIERWQNFTGKKAELI